MASRVAVVGSLSIDLIARAPHLPRPGETVAGSTFFTCPGAKGGNQAVAAARLGASVAMVGCVGSDAYGPQVRDALAHEGIDITAVTTVDGPTGVAMIFVEEGGQNAIVVIPGANAALTPALVERHTATLAQADVVVAQCEIPLETVIWLAAYAHAHDKTLVLNPAPAHGPLPRTLLARATYVIPNEVEAGALTGLPVDTDAQARAAAELLRALGAPAALITLGARGVMAASAGGTHHHPAQVVDVVDTTAAGDAFVGGFATALAEGRDLTAAIAFGQATAALAVTRVGTQPSLPFRRELSAPPAGAG
jgi:ribokinase